MVGTEGLAAFALEPKLVAVFLQDRAADGCSILQQLPGRKAGPGTGVAVIGDIQKLGDHVGESPGLPGDGLQIGGRLRVDSVALDLPPG